mgnify:CR=1 FL=1
MSSLGKDRTQQAQVTVRKAVEAYRGAELVPNISLIQSIA